MNERRPKPLPFLSRTLYYYSNEIMEKIINGEIDTQAANNLIKKIETIQKRQVIASHQKLELIIAKKN